jgi:sulfur-carrier protein
VIVRMVLPRSLAELAGGQRSLSVSLAAPATLGDAVTSISESYPALGRRLVDETGQLRRFVNIYVGVDECRRLGGLGAVVADGDELSVIGSIAGG